MNDSLCKEGYKTKPKEKKSQNLEKQTEPSQGKDIAKIKQQERLIGMSVFSAVIHDNNTGYGSGQLSLLKYKM